MALPLQQSVNQLFQFGTLAASMSPTIQEKAKQRESVKAAQKNVESKQKALDVISEATVGGDAEISNKITAPYEKDLAAAQEDLFKKDPSKETVSPVIERRKYDLEAKKESPIERGSEEWKKAVEEEVEKRRLREQFEQDVKTMLHPPEEANSKMAKKGLAQVKQKAKHRRLMNYLKEMPETKNLSESARKQIQSSLTQKEKTQLMDEWDKQKKRGGK